MYLFVLYGRSYKEVFLSNLFLSVSVCKQGLLSGYWCIVIVAFKWNILFYLFFSRTIKLFHLRLSIIKRHGFSCTKWHRNENPTPVYSEKIVLYTKYKYNHVLKCTHSIHLYPSVLSRSVKTKVTLQFSNLENKR